MRSTKKLTLSAMLIALGTALMALGAVIEVMDLTMCAIASLMVAFVYIEIGSPYTWLVWLCTSLATFICFSGSFVWMEYLAIFGVYPLIKAFIEKLPRGLWLIVKFVYVNAVIWALFFFVELVFSIPFFDGGSLIMNAVLYVVMLVAFFAYDMFITVAVRIYFARIRHRFSRFLK